MNTLSRYQLWYGREEAPGEEFTLSAGPRAVRLVSCDLRYLRARNLELLRRLYAAVLPKNSIPTEAADELLHLIRYRRPPWPGAPAPEQAEGSGVPALYRLRLHEVHQILPAIQQLREHHPDDAEGGGDLVAAVLAADTSVVQSDSQLALRPQHSRGEQGPRQQQRPAESERVTDKFPNGMQDISSRDQ